MARLEFVAFQPWREVVCDRDITWQVDAKTRANLRLPQIFWKSGEGWAEANHMAFVRLIEGNSDPETVKSLMKHLRAYAEFLEEAALDWRHFPVRVSQRALVQFRGKLVELMQRGSLSSSTARARMSAVIQFYRHAAAHDLVSPESPMWRERSVVRPFYDVAGFRRSMTQLSTDLAIPSRARQGARLEDGLVPLSEEHMTRLLQFTAARGNDELRLMLTTGFFTGARLETICTLRIESLEKAYPDPSLQGIWLLRVGPGTSVATKFDVQGVLLVPDFLLAALKQHAYSTKRLIRETRAAPDDRTVLFLTRSARPYSSNTVSRLMTDLRSDALREGLPFLTHFKFHQTRATYGTWLMKLALQATTVGGAIEFVKGAMLHKYESTTFRYVRFLETTKGKQEAAEAFSAAFTGLTGRSWNSLHA